MGLSSDSSDGVVCIRHPFALVLMVNRLPVEVFVVLVIDSTVDEWLHHVNEEKCWDCRENKSYPVAR